MEKNTLLRWTVLLVMATAFLTMAARVSITHTASYDQSNVNIGTDTLGGVTYTTVNYAGLYNGGVPGAPSLPIDFIRFSVPYNASNFSVTVSPSSAISLQSEIIYPCQPPRMMNDTTPLTITFPDSSIYYSNTSYPSQLAWVVDEGFLAGENHIVTVAVLPWYYKHATRPGMVDKLKLYRSVSLTLSYDVDGTPSMFPIVRQDTALRSEGYRLTQEMVVNPSQVQTNAPSQPPTLDPASIITNLTGDGLNGGFEPRDSVGNLIDTLIVPDPFIQNIAVDTCYYPYLIITMPGMKKTVRRIAALKNQKGYHTKVVTMNEVKNSLACSGDIIKQTDSTYIVAFNDDAGVLRQYLKNCYRDNGTKFVLLADKRLPYRTKLINDEFYDGLFVSDYYYSDLSANWDSDKLDRFPELFVGRIPSINGIQIENYSEKLFRYELNPGNGNASYLRNSFFSESLQFMNHLKTAKKNLRYIFPEQNRIVMNEDPNSRYPKDKDVIDTLNTVKVGFMCMFNHGSKEMINLYGYGHDTIQYNLTAYNTRNGINCITNKQHPMIFYAPSCNTAFFNDSSIVSFGESFITGKDYGGPVYIGYTRELLDLPMKQVLGYFTKRLMNDELILGKADAFSFSDVNNSFAFHESLAHAYLGDPSLNIWTDEPSVFSNIDVIRTNDSISITGIDVNAIPTFVAYYSNNGICQKVTTNSSGITLNNINPNGTIMVYKKNYLPFIAPLSIQNETINKSQYVIASDFIAGRFVDSRRTSGDVTVKNGVEYEIEASGTVTLESGFNVEKGATFAVYPSCF